MICPQCGSDQPSGARFCNQCGTRLPPPAASPAPGVCARCGAQNPPESKFCAECGAPLVQARDHASAPPSADSAAGAPPWVLVSAGGAVVHFPASAENVWNIGREDPVTGVFPEIDLTPFDAEQTVSRRHAQIAVFGQQPMLTGLAATNGTRVNGMPLAAGQSVPLVPGDRIEFGRCAMTFRVGS